MDLVIPRSGDGLEPFHAVYRRATEEFIKAGILAHAVGDRDAVMPITNITNSVHVHQLYRRQLVTAQFLTGNAQPVAAGDPGPQA